MPSSRTAPFRRSPTSACAKPFRSRSAAPCNWCRSRATPAEACGCCRARRSRRSSRRCAACTRGRRRPWSIRARTDSGEEGRAGGVQTAGGRRDFLSRIYYDLRNLGITPEDRALNYAATNAFQAAEVIAAATAEGRDLDRIAVHKSPVCRPDSDCYDVELSFFNPDNTNVAARVFRFTIDVSDVIPVSIGTTRSFTRRL